MPAAVTSLIAAPHRPWDTGIPFGTLRRNSPKANQWNGDPNQVRRPWAGLHPDAVPPSPPLSLLSR